MWLGVPIKGNQRARTSLQKNEWLVKSLLHPEPTVLIIIEFFFFEKEKEKKYKSASLTQEYTWRQNWRYSGLCTPILLIGAPTY